MNIVGMTDMEKKTRTISFRVQDGVYSEFENQCLAANISKSELFRDYISRNKVQVIARPRMSRDARRAVFLIQKASNNLNQLAHRVNTEFNAGVLSERTFVGVANQLAMIASMLGSAGNVD